MAIERHLLAAQRFSIHASRRTEQIRRREHQKPRSAKLEFVFLRPRPPAQPASIVRPYTRLKAVGVNNRAKEPRSGERVFRRYRGLSLLVNRHHGLQPWLRSNAAPRLGRYSSEIGSTSIMTFVAPIFFSSM